MALNTKKKAKTEETTNNDVVYTVSVRRAKEITGRNGGTSYAFDMDVNGVTIYGCWVQSKKDGSGNFISFPSYKGSDGKYYSHVYFKIDETLQAEIEKQIEEKLA